MLVGYSLSVLMLVQLGIASRIAMLRATYVPSRPTPSHLLCTQRISMHRGCLRMGLHLPQLGESGEACFHRYRCPRRLVRIFPGRHDDALSATRRWEILCRVERFDVVMRLTIPLLCRVVAAPSSALGLRFRRHLECASVGLNFCCGESQTANICDNH